LPCHSLPPLCILSAMITHCSPTILLQSTPATFIPPTFLMILVPIINHNSPYIARFIKLFQLQRQRPITLQIKFVSIRNDSRLLSIPPSAMFPITYHSPTLFSSSYFTVVSAATSLYQSMCRYYCASTFASSIRSCRLYWHNILLYTPFRCEECLSCLFCITL